MAKDNEFKLLSSEMPSPEEVLAMTPEIDPNEEPLTLLADGTMKHIPAFGGKDVKIHDGIGEGKPDPESLKEFIGK